MMDTCQDICHATAIASHPSQADIQEHNHQLHCSTTDSIKMNNNHCNFSIHHWTISKLWILGILLSLMMGLTTAQCPVKYPCECDNNADKGLIINCRSNRLTEVPQFSDTTDSFYELTLHRNDISEINANAFKTGNGQPLNIRKLDLGRNDITSINDNAFVGLENNLEELVLQVAGMTTFPMQALRRLTKLKKLYLEGFNMDSLPSGALSDFAQLQMLSMKDCSLTSLAANDLQAQQNSLSELYLEGNAFQSVPNAALSTLSSLTTLDLGQNSLSNLPSETFSGLDTLQVLDLTQNSLDSVHPEAFKGLERSLLDLQLGQTKFHDTNLQALTHLSNLQTLNLHNSLVNSLPQGVFDGMDNLQTLNLHGCGITILGYNAFGGLDALEELDLVSNGISSIADGAFEGLGSLKILHLNGQALSNTLNSGTFQGLENNLEELSLAGTNMNAENLKTIERLSNLRILTVTTNLIDTIPLSTFVNLGQLETLELDSNELSNLDQQSLGGLRSSLKEINLNNNKITSLDQCVFFEFQKLQTIKLSTNSLNCDCSLRWMREWIDDQSGNMVYGTCSSPQEHAGTDLSNVNAEDMTCFENPDPITCTPYTTPTMAPSTQNPNLSTAQPQPILVNISDVTDTSIHVSWVVLSSQDITGFTLEITIFGTAEVIQENFFDADTRSTPVRDLSPAIQYMACLHVQHENPENDNNACHEFTTEPSSAPNAPGTSQLGIILGSVIGVLCFIIFIVCLVFCIRRCHRSTDPFYAQAKQPGLPSHSEMPQVGYNSKRFSKPKAMSLQNLSNQDLEKKLEGFSQEERDRILNLLTSSGASTLSMISHASSNRYLQEPLPHPPGFAGAGYASGASNYPPMQYLNAGRSNEEGDYQEIPVDQYEYIPADQVTKYDYIPADKVVKLDVEEPIPPTPPAAHPPEDASSKWI